MKEVCTDLSISIDAYAHWGAHYFCGADWHDFSRVDIFAQNIVFGVVLIAAVAISIDRTKIPIVK